MTEPVLVAWSGGKDSALALQEILGAGRYRVAALLTTVTGEYDRISMHGVRRTLLRRQAESLDLPLEEVVISPSASNDEYEASMGAALEGLFPLWLRDTGALAADFVRQGYKAVLACVDSRVLPGAFAGREFDVALLRDLPSGVDPCGENGEFHTFVYAGPILRAPVPHRRGAIVVREGRFVYCDLEEIPTS